MDMYVWEQGLRGQRMGAAVTCHLGNYAAACSEVSSHLTCETVS